MTKKDYIKAAEIVRAIKSLHDRTVVMYGMAELFQSDNPRFDPDRFKAACDPVSPTLQARKGTVKRPVSV